jgi:hypothetical protein
MKRFKLVMLALCATLLLSACGYYESRPSEDSSILDDVAWEASRAKAATVQTERYRVERDSCCM